MSYIVREWKRRAIRADSYNQLKSFPRMKACTSDQLETVGITPEKTDASCICSHFCFSTKPGSNGTKETPNCLPTLRKAVLDPKTIPISPFNKQSKSPTEYPI
jgi:hypothetical protein